MLRIIAILALTLLTSISFAKPFTHVIYITWDGVRWQDIFDKERFPIFWKKYHSIAQIYGQPETNRKMEVASIPVSLPSYQSQMSGVVLPCADNDCGRLQMPTLSETLVNQLGFAYRDVVSISSWEVTDNAWESIAGTAFSNDGTRPMLDPDTHIADPEMLELNRQQEADYPGDDTRLDKYTMAQAMHYFQKYLPKFLWISLGDADDYAHDGNLQAYRETLTYYDKTLDQLLEKLKTLNVDKDTLVIVTTDHGRGDGDNWVDHGEELPESKQTWAFVFNGELLADAKKDGKEFYSTLGIRPTIEKAFTS